MLSFLILLILAWQFYIGYRRGIFLQGIYFLGALVSTLVASLLYQGVADFLYLLVPYASPVEGSSVHFFDVKHLFELDKVFYAGLAFFIVYLLTYVVIRFLGIFLHFMEVDQWDTDQTKYGAGAISVVVTWFGIEMILTILATLPVPLVQDHLQKSLLARMMIHTPLFSQFLHNFWLVKILV